MFSNLSLYGARVGVLRECLKGLSRVAGLGQGVRNERLRSSCACPRSFRLRAPFCGRHRDTAELRTLDAGPEHLARVSWKVTRRGFSRTLSEELLAPGSSL